MKRNWIVNTVQIELLDVRNVSVTISLTKLAYAGKYMIINLTSLFLHIYPSSFENYQKRFILAKINFYGNAKRSEIYQILNFIVIL